MTWPNHATWCAELHERTIESESGPRFLWVVDCGSLSVPSGRLVACDPFACMDAGNNPYVPIPPGTYPVTVTLADVSDEQDRSHIREAYATLRIAPGVESYRQVLALAREGEARPTLTGDEFIGFPVDAGTACFVDDLSTKTCMPVPNTWFEGLFENDQPQAWSNMMDDPQHIRNGLANIPLPLAKNGENIVIIHSGWGDGTYPVIGSFDSGGKLLAVHIDFFVID